MITVIISAIVFALLTVFIRGCGAWGRIIYTLIFGVAGALIGLMIALQIPAKYELVKSQSYHIVSSDSDAMTINDRDITFLCKENGKITRRKISADFIEIIYTSDKVYYLVETNFKNTNKFSLQKDKTNVRVFIPNPHQ
jgi:hypothetical protein